VCRPPPGSRHRSANQSAGPSWAEHKCPTPGAGTPPRYGGRTPRRRQPRRVHRAIPRFPRFRSNSEPDALRRTPRPATSRGLSPALETTVVLSCCAGPVATGADPAEAGLRLHLASNGPHPIRTSGGDQLSVPTRRRVPLRAPARYEAPTGQPGPTRSRTGGSPKPARRSPWAGRVRSKRYSACTPRSTVLVPARPESAAPSRSRSACAPCRTPAPVFPRNS
jgi:hypothetical protein